jgi:DUF1680 family protein
VNPLEVWPETCIENSSRSHVKPVRQKWFDCACCPTNLARTLTSLGQYIYFINENDVYINLFIQNEASFEISGKPVSLSLKTDYPRTGLLKIGIKTGGFSKAEGFSKASELQFSLNVRIPGYTGDFSASLNGRAAAGEKLNGYYRITRSWNDDEIEISFPLKPRLVYANPRVHQSCGKVAIARGPEIYCFEETDNGANLAALSLDAGAPLDECWMENLLGGVMLVKTRGKRLVEPDASESFSDEFVPSPEKAELIALPYGFWGNRSLGEMLVWIRLNT